ncbi:unnamed protein product [Phaeothamnion confervicola]
MDDPPPSLRQGLSGDRAIVLALLLGAASITYWYWSNRFYYKEQARAESVLLRLQARQGSASNTESLHSGPDNGTRSNLSLEGAAVTSQKAISLPADPCAYLVELRDHAAIAASAATAADWRPEILPLKTVEDIMGYSGPPESAKFARRMPFVAPPLLPHRPKLLVCHDMAGGYVEDRWVQGGDYDMAYRLYDWGMVDTFVYFSHNLVTAPPVGWCNVAHRHGTRVLGTFITEWEAGAAVCARLFATVAGAEDLARRLAAVARDYGFDGWLVNIENPLEPLEEGEARSGGGSGGGGGGSSSGGGNGGGSGGGNSMRASTNSGAAPRVIWYDSVTVGGDLCWQNCLNANNKAFFDCCDGIFTNVCIGHAPAV